MADLQIYGNLESIIPDIMYQVLSFIPFEAGNWKNISLANKYFNKCAAPIFTRKTLDTLIMYKMDYKNHDTEEVITSMVKNVEYVAMRKYVEKAFCNENILALAALAKRASSPPLTYAGFFCDKYIPFAASQSPEFLKILLSSADPNHTINKRIIYDAAVCAIEFDRTENLTLLLKHQYMRLKYLLGLQDIVSFHNKNHWADEIIYECASIVGQHGIKSYKRRRL